MKIALVCLPFAGAGASFFRPWQEHAGERLDVAHNKMVIEVVRRGVNKGAGVEVLMTKPPFAGRKPVFVGDDATDETVFAVMPRLGGLAILAGILAAGLIFLPPGKETTGILAGATVIVAVGIADDLLDLTADVKFAGQVLAAVIPVAAGVRVETMTLPFLGHLDLGWASYPLTVIGIVAVMNIVNFIDGVDGLAAGVCTISGLTFAVHGRKSLTHWPLLPCCLNLVRCPCTLSFCPWSCAIGLPLVNDSGIGWPSSLSRAGL